MRRDGNLHSLALMQISSVLDGDRDWQWDGLLLMIMIRRRGGRVGT